MADNLQQSTQFHRDVAYKVSLSELSKGEFVKGEGLNPNSVLLENTMKVSRVNVLGILVNIQSNESSSSFIIDDGTNQLLITTFNNQAVPKDLSLGSLIQVIGRIRKSTEGFFISAETITSLKDAGWLQVRKLELQKRDLTISTTPTPTLTQTSPPPPQQNPEYTQSTTTETSQPQIGSTMVEEVRVEEPATQTQEPQQEEKETVQEIPLTQETPSPSTPQPEPSQPQQSTEEKSDVEKVHALIKELDQGQGALFEEIIAKSQIQNTEELLNHLLKEGDIFEVSPGKLKVLE